MAINVSPGGILRSPDAETKYGMAAILNTVDTHKLETLLFTMGYMCELQPSVYKRPAQPRVGHSMADVNLW